MKVDFETEQCFFCEKFLMPRNIGGSEAYKYWKDKYGYVMKTTGSIGNKQLCRNCVTDIVGIVEGERNDY